MSRDEKLVGPGDAVLILPNVDYAAEILDDLEVVALRLCRTKRSPPQRGGPGGGSPRPGRLS